MRPILIALALAASLGLAEAKTANPPSPPSPPKAPAKAAALPAPKPAPAPEAPLPPPPPAPPSLLREIGGIEEYRLANGLQILLFPDEAQSTTTVNIMYRVGSRHESQGEYGMAHLLEHLLFKGTPSLRDIPEEFARRGMRWNGTTTADRTNYFASFNANEQTLDFVLRFEADRMLNSLIAKSDLDKEMNVVRNEFERGENEPMQVLNKRVQALAYDWNAYGHSTIGPKSDIENVPIERLQAFYKRFYRPDNAMLMVAGRFDKEATLQRIAAAFGPLGNPAGPVPEPYTVEPAQDGERLVVVRRVGGQPALMAYYHVPALAHPDSAPLVVLGLMLSLQPSGQLYKELVEPRLALSAGIGGLGGVEPGGMRAVAVLPPDADLPKVEQRLLDLIEGRAGKPFDESELQRVRELALLSYREQMKNPEALIQQISGLGAADWRLLFQLMEDLPKVSLADVERVRRAYLRPANRSLGRYLPSASVERVEIPAAPPLNERLAALKGPPRLEDGERFDPTPEQLAARTRSEVLPSGIELHTLAKRTRGNTVRLEMQLRWGERRATFARRGTDLVGRLMSEGSRSYDKQQLRDALQRLKASMSIGTADQGLLLSLSAEQDSLLEALKIAADVLQAPLLPREAFERGQQSALAALQAARQEPESLRQQAVRAHYNQARGVGRGDPDYLRSIDERLEDVKATSLDDVRRFYADYVSANEARVAVVGALPEGLAAAIEQLFGGWKKPAAPRYVRYIAPAITVAPARFDVPARDKANALAQWRQDFALNDRDPDYLPLLLAHHVFGGGALENRLATRVRQREGLSYGIGSGLAVSHFGHAAGLTIGGSFAPQNRDQVLDLVQQELRRLSEQGITEAELARAKTDVLEARRQSRAREAVLASSLLRMADDGESWAEVARREAELQAVSVEQANAAWRRLIRPDGFVISTVGDFK
ncbi:M16 family metallopeptidase [Roseateles violae]|uniref:Pitrilysin family protein n=1 Tax=Roseateles violae TaxID=3058042 RepID=A0ABT8DZ33_9BURK|nr:pitrilysin family protein [Pelomonas sp. PFR6]MDN3922819.1 pitrilysin family protein [Pelomonas sp. PFR6]